MIKVLKVTMRTRMSAGVTAKIKKFVMTCKLFLRLLGSIKLYRLLYCQQMELVASTVSVIYFSCLYEMYWVCTPVHWV